MSKLSLLLTKPKSRKVAIVLALLGTVTPLAGLHKFYLKQPLWGALYFLLWSSPIPRIACAIEAVWYLAQDLEQFNYRFNSKAENLDATTTEAKAIATRASDIATALQQLDQLRANGLMSEYEFEQKRRQLIERL